jgi:hypothetical protein
VRIDRNGALTELYGNSDTLQDVQAIPTGHFYSYHEFPTAESAGGYHVRFVTAEGTQSGSLPLANPPTFIGVQ